MPYMTDNTLYQVKTIKQPKTQTVLKNRNSIIDRTFRKGLSKIRHNLLVRNTAIQH